MAMFSEFQNSFLKSADYPENLIRGGTATYSSKLVSYRKRLVDAGPDLCLTDGEDNVEADYEIPIIDLDTDDGKGKLLITGRFDTSLLL
jgi:hypothetical protein